MDPKAREPLPLKAIENYPSAKEHEEDLRLTYIEDVKDGLALGPMTEAQAADICNCEVGDLIHGALAGKPEANNKIRTIHDGTICGVNERMQANMHEKTTLPTVCDLLQATTTWESLNLQPYMLLTADVTKAHPRI